MKAKISAARGSNGIPRAAKPRRHAQQGADPVHRFPRPSRPGDRPRLPEPEVHTRLPAFPRRRGTHLLPGHEQGREAGHGGHGGSRHRAHPRRAQYLLPGDHLPDRGLLRPCPRPQYRRGLFGPPQLRLHGILRGGRLSLGLLRLPAALPPPRHPGNGPHRHALLPRAGLVLPVPVPGHHRRGNRRPPARPPGPPRPRRLPRHHHPRLRRGGPPAAEQPRQAAEPHERPPGHHADPTADPPERAARFLQPALRTSDR